MTEQLNLPDLGSGDHPPVSGHSIAAKVLLMAEHLDSTGKRTAPITVRGQRATLQRTFKPRERGGPLCHGEHQLILKDGRRPIDAQQK